MNFRLLLAASGHAATARAVPLRAEVFQTSPGGEDVAVSFRPNRSDDLYTSAKAGAQLAYRVLFGEGVVRSQLAVRLELEDAPENVLGRSADLALALAIVRRAYEASGRLAPTPNQPTSIAATGILDVDGAVRAVDHLTTKLEAACSAFGATPATLFFPSESFVDGSIADLQRQHPAIRFIPVDHLDQALEALGIPLERIYLRNPFRGLQYFEYEHHAIFFGRDVEIRTVVEQLLRREANRAPGILVEGASGSGKSSFMRAGILPALVNPCSQAANVQECLRRRPIQDSVRHGIWRPGHLSNSADEAQIAQSILGCWRALPELAGKLPSRVKSLEALADERRRGWPSVQRFVWLIDQFEELFALGFDAPIIDAVACFLMRLQSEGVWTLACMRVDAVPQLKQHATFREVFGSNEGQYYLDIMRGTALDDVITRPAQAAGLSFGATPSGQRLDHVLREELYPTQENTLPLLQFTLQELYRRRSGNVLLYETYAELGGLSGSVATAAEAAIQADLAESEQVLPGIFRSLISVDDEGRPSKRYALLADVTSDPAQRKLLDRMVNARLCVRDQHDGSAVVAFAHEALLRTWPRLRDWLSREGALLQVRELAQRETRLWLEHGRSHAWLAAADKVVSFRALETAAIPLAAETRDFIDRSEQQVRRTTRIKHAAVALIVLLAIATSIGAWMASRREHEAQYQTAQARKAQLRTLTQVATERLKDGDLTLARGIILEVLKRVPASERPDPEAVNVFQETRANDAGLAVLAGHTAPVHDVAYSPDGSRIVSASNDHTARIWDARTGVQLQVLTGHAREVRSAVYSADGTEILTGSLDGTARTWDARTGSPRRVLHHARLVACASYSPDGTRILTAGDGRWRVWDAASGASLAEFSGHRSGCARYSPDGTRIVMSSDDQGPVRIWDAHTGLPLVALNVPAYVLAAVYSADGRQVATTSKDGTARTWDARSGAPLLVLSGHQGDVYSAVWSPDGAIIATTSEDKTVRIWDAKQGTQIKVLTGHIGMVLTAAFSPDGMHLVTGGWDSVARVWDLAGGPHAVVLSGHTEGVGGVAYSPDGLRVATSSWDKTARVWDARTGAQLAVLSGHTAELDSVAYSPDGSHVVTASGDKTARVWDAYTGEPLLTLSAPEGVQMAGYSPDGGRIVGFFYDLRFGIWDAHTGKLLAISPGHHANNTGVEGGSATYSPDGRWILTGSLDKTARVWDANTLAPVAVLLHSDMVSAASYSPDGTRIVTATDDRNAYVWDAATAVRIGVLWGHHSPVGCAAFSPDGSHIVTSSGDSTVRIWDAHSMTQLAVLAEHSTCEVAWSPDGMHVAATDSSDNAASIWDARIPADLPGQILWDQAAEPDPLSDVQRTQLGFPPAISLLGDSSPESGAGRSAAATRPSPCDLQAAAFYDPDRRAQGVDQTSINPELASASCVREAASKEASARTIYQAGRALRASGQWKVARQYFERALAKNYSAARIDLALLLSDPSAAMLDPDRAVSLLEQAWDAGIPIAGFALGALYERGALSGDGTGHPWLPDPARASRWYQEAAKRDEPNSLARLAQRVETEAVTRASAAQDPQLLTAFTLYARAVARAEALDWPVSVWRPWRYRRASLARVLAADGMMQQTADSYRRVLRDARR